jgi:hypothetical protein
MIKPIMAIIARRRLATLYQERDNVTAAIGRARKHKKAVRGLYEAAQRNNKLCLYWEQFLR